MLSFGSNGLEHLIDHYQKSIISGSAFYQGINKPADKNPTGQHRGTDHDAEDGYPNDSRDVHRGYVTARYRQLPNFAIVAIRYKGGASGGRALIPGTRLARSKAIYGG